MDTDVLVQARDSDTILEILHREYRVRLPTAELIAYGESDELRKVKLMNFSWGNVEIDALEQLALSVMETFWEEIDWVTCREVAQLKLDAGQLDGKHEQVCNLLAVLDSTVTLSLSQCNQ